ncbi:MAG: phenylalanine--tRNA ligase subunit beta [Nitrosomonadaceae bacterium]|jgi:phenylalanyl-tRNA synthetase beta chain|nr:phenylalanine--tRNA ligase subunit beta [Nitrosomonadaceae bacterium]
MKVSVNWLKELVAVDLSADQIAHRLTMAGLEVEEQSPVAGAFNKIVVAEVRRVEPHPNADKLRVTEVDAGTGAPLQIVCGAPNVAVGMRVPCALVGAVLPGLEIKQAKLRSVESNGMLCSARELGLSDDHGGLLALPADAPIGQDVRQYLDLDDVILTLKMTPNRGDCLSMLGVARDLAAITGAALRMPVTPTVANTGAATRGVSIEANPACGHYLGRVITNINAKAPTPEWMKRRLERAGFRSISALVDITNYLTLERGRPMHAFDNDKLKGSITVRWPKAGERMTLLNEQAVDLAADMLLIADEAGPVAMGGVMGGLESSVTDVTTSIFFEAAYFAPDAIQGKTRALNINSDAAFRFERGVDPASAREGIEYATALAVAICGTPATEVGPISEANGTLPTRAPIRVRAAQVNALIGMQIQTTEMVEILQRLNCTVSAKGDELMVTPPSYRFDLNIEADFAEEVARVHGYENVPAHPPRATVPITHVSDNVRTRSAFKRLCSDLGYQEVINYSFVPEQWEVELMGNAKPIRLANPIASQMSVMRTSLLGGLIETLRNNLNRGEDRAKLFEVGRCFLGSEADLACQPELLGGLVFGPRHPEQWGQPKAERADYFSVKADVEELLGPHLGMARFESMSANPHPALHPGRSAEIRVDGKPVGWLGELHPRWQQQFDLPSAPIVFSLSLAALSDQAPIRYAPISRMQPVRRDVALLLDEKVSNQAILDRVKSLKETQKLTYLVDFGVFDLYRGANLDSGKKSLAFRIVMQDTERTLTDVEADQVVAKFVEVMSQEFGATLRK